MRIRLQPWHERIEYDDAHLPTLLSKAEERLLNAAFEMDAAKYVVTRIRERAIEVALAKKGILPGCRVLIRYSYGEQLATFDRIASGEMKVTYMTKKGTPGKHGDCLALEDLPCVHLHDATT